MLIAIVILGLGMVMVATMFPVAWNRARDLTEYTSQVAVSEGAHTTLKLLARVDGLSKHGSSFAGDLVFQDNGGGNNDILYAFADTRMHALHIENVLAERPSDPTARPIVPKRDEPWTEVFAPWMLERVNFDLLYCNNPNVCNAVFLASQVDFESSVQPPMPLWDDVESLDVGEREAARLAWYEDLDTRRFAWAVLHRLREQVGPTLTSLTPLEDARGAADTTRNFDIYYVTLRRPQPVLRYARQDPNEDSAPDPADPEHVTTPAALGPEQDVLFPSPWRVQVRFPDPEDPACLPNCCNWNDCVTIKPPTHIPSQIEVNTQGFPTTDFLMDMFQVDTQLIDERTGQVYTVTGRRFTNDDQTEGRVTLNREVLCEDVCDHAVITGKLLVRTVWVFPPPVRRRASGNDPLVFYGKQPVVGIDVRTLSLSPVQ